MGQDGNSDDGPDLNELLRGAAHGYDMIRRVTSGDDPKTRVAAQHLDKVSLQDALSQANDALGNGQSGGDEPATPHIDAHERDVGIEVTVDLSNTLIEAKDIDVELEGDALTLSEDGVGWTASVSNISDKIDADGADVSVIRNNRLVSITITPEESDTPDKAEGDDGDSGGLSTGLDGESDIDMGMTSDPDSAEVGGEGDGEGEGDSGVEIDNGSDDGVPTVEEFIEDNPWVREIIGDDEVDMAIEFMGDQPVDDVLGDQLGDLGV